MSSSSSTKKGFPNSHAIFDQRENLEKNVTILTLLVYFLGTKAHNEHPR